MEELPSGWITTKSGDLRHTSIEPGTLSQLLSEAIKGLEFNLLTGEIEIGRQPMDSGFVENFYIPLSEWGYKITKHPATDALIFAAQKNSYHPVVDELKRIELDEKIQPIDLNQVSSEYLGTEDHLYDEMLACWLIGLVQRALHPGSKFDNVLVLQGPEGIRKSTFFEYLAGNKDWVCDTWQKIEQKRYMAIGQCWIYELAELDHMTSKNHQGALKAMFTSATDVYAKPYARGMGRFPRPSVFAGTCNRFDFLSDASASHRRYWIIPLPHDPEKDEKLDTNKVKRDRDQILKAAILGYRNGRKPFLTQEKQNQSNLRNKNFLAEHPFMDALADWIKRSPFEKEFTTTQALIDSGLREKDKIQDWDLKKASECLHALGYRKDEHQRRSDIGRKRFWRKRE